MSCTLDLGVCSSLLAPSLFNCSFLMQFASECLLQSLAYCSPHTCSGKKPLTVQELIMTDNPVGGYPHRQQLKVTSMTAFSAAALCWPRKSAFEAHLSKSATKTWKLGLFPVAPIGNKSDLILMLACWPISHFVGGSNLTVELQVGSHIENCDVGRNRWNAALWRCVILC